MGKSEQYGSSIHDAILDLFDEEDGQYDFEEIDGTEFFLGMIKACAIIFNEFTNSQSNALEFTHTAQKLIVQDLIKNGKVVD